MFNFKRSDWFKKGRKKVEPEPDYSGIESPMKYMVVPKSPHRWDVYQINRKDAEFLTKKKGREPSLEEWTFVIYSTSENAAKGYIYEKLEQDRRDVFEMHRDLAFRRDNQPYEVE